MFSSISIIGLAIFISSFSFTLAQSSTVTLYIPGFDTQALVGSIAGTESSLTTYVLGCAPSTTDGDECGLRSPITLTENASTAKYTIPGETTDGTLAFTGYVDCSLYSTASAVCVESFGGTDANFPGTATETYSGTDLPFMPVVITAGVAVHTGSGVPLTSGVSATTTTISTSGSPAAASSASSLKGSGTGSTKTAGASQAATTVTSTSTGGGPAAITRHAGCMVGGAAVAMAMMVY